MSTPRKCVCVCVFLLGVRVTVCVLFHGRGVARGLTALAFASTPFLRGETLVRLRSMTRHTLSQPLCAAGPGSRATCSPLTDPGNQGRVSRWCQPLPRGPLGQRLPAVRRTDQCPKWVVVPNTLAGGIPPETVTHTITKEASSSPIKGSDESFNQTRMVAKTARLNV